MTATFHDLLELKKLPFGHSKKVLADTGESHIWIHGDDPGTQGPMHRHTADEIFYCVQGECTFTLAGGRRKRLKRGMVVFIPKGDYLARFGTGGEPVGDNLWALENRAVIEARRHAIAAKSKTRTGAKKPAGAGVAKKTSARRRA